MPQPTVLPCASGLNFNTETSFALVLPDEVSVAFPWAICH